VTNFVCTLLFSKTTSSGASIAVCPEPEVTVVFGVIISVDVLVVELVLDLVVVLEVVLDVVVDLVKVEATSMIFVKKYVTNILSAILILILLNIHILMLLSTDTKCS
jgi:hypothetical protein